MRYNNHDKFEDHAFEIFYVTFVIDPTVSKYARSNENFDFKFCTMTSSISFLNKSPYLPETFV